MNLIYQWLITKPRFSSFKTYLINVLFVLQEVSDKGDKITQLENEKSALIRDLFNSKTSGKNGFSAKKGNHIF